MRTPVYMDHHASTPLDPRVLEAMLPYLKERFGNAASRTHVFGREAAEALEGARASVAQLIGAGSDEIFFTSGATESDNLALFGLFGTRAGGGGHLVVARTEHPAVLDPARRLEALGVRVTRLEVDRWGRVDPQSVDRALGRDTRLVSIMAANNEIGTLGPLRAIGRIARRRDALFHSDAAQAFGRVPLDVESMGLDLVSVSSHKIHGPQGVGALYVRRALQPRLEPLLHGGGHERGLRSGTPNVPGIVGLGRAAEIAAEEMEAEGVRLAGLRDRLFEAVRSGLGDAEANGHPAERLPNNLSLYVPGVEGEALVTAVPDVALSTGSACASAARKPSHVLEALGLGPDRSRCSVRLGLGRFTSREEVDYVAARLVEAARRLRRLSPSPRAARGGL